MSMCISTGSSEPWLLADAMIISTKPCALPISVAPITLLRTCVIENNIQGRSPNVARAISHTIWNCFKRKHLFPLGANSFL